MTDIPNDSICTAVIVTEMKLCQQFSETKSLCSGGIIPKRFSFEKGNVKRKFRNYNTRGDTSKTGDTRIVSYEVDKYSHRAAIAVCLPCTVHICIAKFFNTI